MTPTHLLEETRNNGTMLISPRGFVLMVHYSVTILVVPHRQETFIKVSGWLKTIYF